MKQWIASALLASVALLVTLLIAPVALAQTGPYPNRQITIVVGFPAGGTTDIAARILAKHMTASTGQSFVVESQPGATGTIAATQMKRVPPDGYTLLVNSIGTYVIALHLIKGLTFDPRTDLDYISLVYEAPNVLVTGPVRPERTAAQVIDLLKKGTPAESALPARAMALRTTFLPSCFFSKPALEACTCRTRAARPP